MISYPMKKKMIVLHIAVYTPLTWHSSSTNPFWGSKGYLEYLPIEGSDPNTLTPGMRIKVPLGTRERVGIFLRTSDQASIAADKLRPAIAQLDKEAMIAPQLMKLALWASAYYQHSIAEVLHSMLPKLLREGLLIDEAYSFDTPSTLSHSTAREDSTYDKEKLELNSDQKAAVQHITSAKGFHTFLLDGVTGSGKTEVYLQAIEKTLQTGCQILVLVPEIALTPQTLGRFKARFSEETLAVLHSSLTPKQRLSAWLKAREGLASIVIGTRSAIFTPFKSLGLIILDEEHDTSFKQQTRFRYSARDLAVVRGKLSDIPVVLGSATPSLESLYNVKMRRYHSVQLPKRAGNARMPTFKLIDLRRQNLKNGLSDTLLRAIEERMARKEQVLLFLNRRGYAPLLMCHTCGWHFECEHCDAHLVLYKKMERLRCHHCDHSIPIPKQCPQCLSTVLITIGVGTEKLAAYLNKQFPDVGVIQIDSNTVKSRSKLQLVLDEVYDGKAQILVGTQMLAKGHHFPNVTLVAVVDADHGLFSTDFRATEYMAQLLLQVAGRAGRAEKMGEVYIQTHHPDHPALQLLLSQGYPAFAKTALAERNKTGLPPYSCITALRVEAKTALKNAAFLNKIRDTLQQQQADFPHLPNIQIRGPIPLSMQRKAGYYRMQLIFQSQTRASLKKALPHITAIVRQHGAQHKGLSWVFDVDPIETF